MTAAHAHNSRYPESGQAVVLSIVALTVLLAMAAFVIDIGRAYHVHRSLQATADAAALAGAEALPSATNAANLAHTYDGTAC